MQPTEETPFVELFRHNTWANLRLLDACEGLTDEQLDASAVGTRGTIRDTLLHFVGAEERYLTLLTGQPPENPLKRGEFPSVADLKEHARRSGEGLAREAARARITDTVTREWQGEELKVKVSTMLIQAIDHATEHRTHIRTILTTLGIEPPEIDGWEYAEAMERTGEG